MLFLMDSVINKYISFNYNFGINVTISEGFPQRYLSPLGKLNVIVSQNGMVLDTAEVQPSQNLRFPFACYQEADIQIFSYLDNKLTKIWEEEFSLAYENVVIDLQPRNQQEFEVWVEYVIWFQKKTECNLFLIHEGYNQDIFPNPSNISAYASYVIYWREDMWANPLGVNVTPYDLINNALLRV